MKLTILGSGTYIPDGGRNTASYLLQTRNNNVVFDLGRGAISGLYKAGHELKDIDSIFITHLHEDHCSELIPLIQQAMSIHGQRFGILKKPLTIYGPKGTKKLIKRLIKAFKISVDKKPTVPVNIIEVKPGQTISEKGWDVTAFKVEHSKTKTCLAYRVEANKKIFVYSGDTVDCPGIREACKNANVALIEATAPKHLNAFGHLDGETAGLIAQESGVKNLLITHVAYEYFKNGRVLKDAQRKFRGKILLAQDGLKVRI